MEVVSLQRDEENDILDKELIELSVRLESMKKEKLVLAMHSTEITLIQSGTYGGCYQTYVKDKNNKRKLFRTHTKEELMDKLYEYYMKVGERATVNDCYNLWISDIRALKKASSAHTYEKAYKRFYGVAKDWYIEDLTVYDIKSFVKQQIVEKELTVKGYAMLKTVLLGILYVANDKYDANIPISRITSELTRELRGSFKKSRKSLMQDEDRVFSDEEYNMIIKFCEESATIVDLGIALLFKSGLRVAELAALSKDDVREYDNGLLGLYIHRTEERISNKAEYVISDTTKTEAGTREVVLSKSASELVQKILLLSDEKSEFVFADKVMDRYPAKKFRDRLYRICIKLGITKRSPHAARRTYASRLYRGGVSEKVITKQMGHIDFDLTMDKYIYSLSSKAEIAHKLDNIV